MEGHFQNGKQDSFGRTLLVQNTLQKQYYTSRLEFVGWWANYASGNGIVKKDEIPFKSGNWAANGGYPNFGRSWTSPSAGEYSYRRIESLAYSS